MIGINTGRNLLIRVIKESHVYINKSIRKIKEYGISVDCESQNAYNSVNGKGEKIWHCFG